MEYGCMRFETEDSIGVLTLSRPKQLNALNAELLREIARCLQEIRRAGDVRCLVITGEGDKAFCAGADIAAMKELSPLEARDLARLGQWVTSSLEDLPVPVIAAVNGFALGGGLELAMACDWMVASERAQFGQPEIRLGILPGFGGTQRLARRIGAPRARELIFRGNRIDAITAERWALVNRVTSPEALLPEVRALAQELAGQPPVALAQAKRTIRLGLDVDLESGLRHEAEAFGVTFSTEDRLEGMEAFLGKRDARFRGK